MKRFLDCTASDFENMKKKELLEAISASEGRVLVCETIGILQPMLGDVTNAEFVASMGADMILLNMFDVNHPVIQGLPACEEPVKKLKELVGRPVGCNLEPVDLEADMLEERHVIAEGRQATVETFKKAQELGFNFICLTGNPGVGVSNRSIAEAVVEAKKYFNGLIIAGKMHGAGVNEPVVDLDAIKEFIDAGADVILMPAVNTVPGLSEATVTEACEYIHAHNALALSAIGTSQEGADCETVREIAIVNKRCGVDIQHIGDAGYGGVAPVENIMAISKAVRGVRHTVSMMARSINR